MRRKNAVVLVLIILSGIATVFLIQNDAGITALAQQRSAESLEWARFVLRRMLLASILLPLFFTAAIIGGFRIRKARKSSSLF